MTFLRIIIIFVILSMHGIVFGQQNKNIGLTDSVDLSELSLDELTKLKFANQSTELERQINQAIEAASRDPLSLRKSASIVSVITAEEIEKSGSRDLIDVLRMILGVDFNVDVEGIVGISFRGMWANEGNILIQIDGQEMNESAYGSLQFGNHYGVSQIKKIEVIRGPGSAIYGGFAEYAVINIITKKGVDIKGITTNILLGQTAADYSKQDIGLGFGNKIGDFSYSLNSFMGRGQRSNLNYTDISNVSYNMNKNSDINPRFLNINLGYKNFSFLFMYDNYITNIRDGYVNALSQPYPCNFLSYMSELKYKKDFKNKLSLEAKFNYKNSVPWTFDGQPKPIDSSYGYYKIITNRYRLNGLALWNPKYWLSVNFGIDGFYDEAFKPNGQLFRADNTDRIHYINFAPFAQVIIKSIFANYIIGVRHDQSSGYGGAFNPRLGITKKLKDFNFKLLYSSSFRAPTIENIQYAEGGIKLKPETSNTLEFETSYKINKQMYISLNVFDITTKNAIRYFVEKDSVVHGDPDGYRNTTRTIGSQGFELEYNYKATFGYIKLNYSYYTVAGKGIDSGNMVNIDNTQVLGIANHKLNLAASINIGKYIYVSPSINYIGKRYGYGTLDSMGKGVLCLYNPQTVLNIYLGSNNIIKNVHFGFGIANITNTKIIYIQPYNSLHAPLPDLGRDFYINLVYNFPFKSKIN